MESPSLRVYGGVAGDDRQAQRRVQLIEAGLELLGGRDEEPSLTVRGVCRQAGLAARYFYESFDDRDTLAIAVFEHVVTDIAATTLEAVEAAPRDGRAKVRAGLSNIVRRITEDPRRGRLLFSTTLSATVLNQRRVESARMFARLLGGQAQEFYGITEDLRLGLVTEFLVGGLAQALASWVNGSLALDEDYLVEHCTEVFLTLGEQSGPGGAA